MNNKLRENRGVTIIHALVGVLIFSIISSIIYSSAIGNLKSVQSETAFQQSYYTVSSAASVFADSIKDDYVEFKVARTYTGASIVMDNSWKYHDSGVTNPLYIEKGDNHGISSEMYSIFRGDVSQVSNTYTINANGDSNRIKPVAVEYLMTADYTIYANFYLKDNNSTDNYHLTVKIPVEKVPSYNGADYDNPVSQQYYEKGFAYNGNTYDYVDTYRITFDSSNIIFEKGKHNVQ